MLEVAIGIIKNDANEFLMSARTSGPYKDFWEFPGGKIEKNEHPAKACIRELNEELGIHVNDIVLIGELKYAYPKRTVLLKVFVINDFSNIPKGCEKQKIQWMTLKDITCQSQDLNFLPTTHLVLDLIH